MNTNDTDMATHAYLTFRIDKELFAVKVGKVREILEVKPITKVPQSPQYLCGIINLRGNMLPIVDLRVKFGLSPTQFTVDTCIIVLDVDLEREPMTIGALVDRAEAVLEISQADIYPSPGLGSKYKPGFIEGMAKKDDDFIMILQTDAVFSADEIILVREAGTEPNISADNNLNP